MIINAVYFPVIYEALFTLSLQIIIRAVSTWNHTFTPSVHPTFIIKMYSKIWDRTFLLSFNEFLHLIVAFYQQLWATSSQISSNFRLLPGISKKRYNAALRFRVRNSTIGMHSLVELIVLNDQLQAHNMSSSFIKNWFIPISDDFINQKIFYIKC